MEKKMLNSSYWSEQYQANHTYWNAGSITTPLKEYFEGIEDKNIKILIPGVGHGHELLYLYRNGFTNVTAIDIAAEALEHIRIEMVDFPLDHLILGDFFDHEGAYDLIVEQTFFCSLQPELRVDYVEKMSQLLTDKGRLVGLLFDDCFNTEGPPYGGSLVEYKQLFEPRMHIQKIEKAYNSIKPRAGRELFIIIERKND